MYITHNHISRLCPQSKGMNKKDLCFETFSFSSKCKQPNGRFVSLFQTDNEVAYEKDTTASLGRKPRPFFIFHMLGVAARIVEKYGIKFIRYRRNGIFMDYRKRCKEKIGILKAANQKQFMMLLDEWKGRV